MMKFSCAIIAGELSADILGSEIIKSTNKDIKWFGVGGPSMKNNGLKSVMNWELIKGFGIGDLILSLPKIFLSLNILSKILLENKPDLILTVDTKGFNFLLVRLIKYKIKSKNWEPKFIHVVAPTVWAWRPNRSKKIKHLFDKLLCLFPNEPDFFIKHGIDAVAVGHPAVERFSYKKEKIDFLKLINKQKTNKKILAILPGSRSSEIRRMLPVLLGALEILKSKLEDPPLFLLQVAVDQKDLIKNIINKRTDIINIDNLSHGDLLTRNADFAILACGTATLEYSLAGVPSIAIYKSGFISAFIGRRLINMNNVVLPNWLLGKKLMEFLFQENCTSKIIANRIINMIDNKNIKIEAQKASIDLKKLLFVNKKSFKQNVKEIIYSEISLKTI